MSQDGISIDVRTLVNNASIKLTALGSVPAEQLPNVSINMVHSNSYSNISTPNPNKSRIFKSKEPRILESLTKTPLLVKLSLKSKDQFAILSYLGDYTYILNYISESFASKLIEPKPNPGTVLSTLICKDEDLTSSWRSALLTKKQNDFKVSMEPPSTISESPAKLTDSNDPFDYFVDRYFGTLYQLTTPLTFFTKSTFSRLKSLCQSASLNYESVLKQFIIEFDRFDNRHSIPNNGLLNSETLFEIELEHRDKFISKSLNLIDVDIHSTNYSETNKSLTNILNTFKIREMQLQLIILLELTNETGQDDLSLLKKASKPIKQSSKRLIGKRRKLTPVISGGAVVPTKDKSGNTIVSYIQHYDSFVDRLLIWETLNSSSASFSSSVMSSNSPASITSTSDYSSAKFITSVIIPYFDRKCPNAVKHMIKKIKGPSFKTHSRDSKRKKPLLKRSSSELSSSASTTARKAPNLSELEDIKLTRSNSDLQQITRNSSFNATNLSRRQIDVSVPIAPIPSQSALLKRSTSSSIFNRVGKKPSSFVEASKELTTKSFSQVDETPVKKQKYINILKTPQDAKFQQPIELLKSNVTSITQGSINSNTTNQSSTKSRDKSLPFMAEIRSSSQEKNGAKPSMNPELQSPLTIRSTIKKPRPGDPFNFDNDGDVSLLLEDSRVKRRLFAPTSSK